jgi:hypothetical protein
MKKAIFSGAVFPSVQWGSFLGYEEWVMNL